MSIFGNCLTAGNVGTGSSFATVRMYGPAGFSLIISKGNFSTQFTYGKLNQSDSKYYYYAFVPQNEFDSSQSFSITGTNTDSNIVLNNNAFYINEIKEFEYKIHYRKYIFKDGITDSLIGGFTALKSISSQTDTIVISNGNLIYTEKDNDYGGIRFNNPINLLDYKYGNIFFEFDDIESWQDSTFKAGIYVSSSLQTDPSNLQYDTRDYISYEGNTSNGHIVNWSGYQGSGISYVYDSTPYYVYILCASGKNSGIPNGIINIKTISLIT